MLQEIRLPVPLAASCAFGGPDLHDLYVTTARYQLSENTLLKAPLSGGVFRGRMPVRGHLPDRYRLT